MQSVFCGMHHWILSLFLAGAAFAYGQEPATLETLKGQRIDRKEAARQNIYLLREGSLLVRLDVQQPKIDYFTRYNNIEEVERIREEVRAEGLAIMDAFRTYYFFCKVYFFSSEDSRNLLQEGPDAVTFFNDSLKPDPNIRPATEAYFVAEFSFVEQDTTSYYSGSTPTPNDENNPEGKTYYGGSKTSKPALVIRDKEFLQLRDPFPFYVGYSYFGRVKKRYRLPVKKLQEQLEAYYNKVSGTQEKNQ